VVGCFFAQERLDADVVDESVVMQLVTDISTAQARTFQDRIATTLQVRSLVTAEQWGSAAGLMKQKRAERRGKRKRPAPVDGE
jgi:Spy/CpxP family protein refolding chaperone